MKTSQAGIDLIKSFEGFRAKAYKDAVGVWTIGYGTTRGVRPGDTMTRAEAEARLRAELTEYERAVERATGGHATQPQFDALVSFAYNVGAAGMARSTVIKRHREGKYQAAARAFGLWNKAGGRELAGLTRRRSAEAAMYLTPVRFAEYSDNSEADSGPALHSDDAMPSPVEPERPMRESQINRAAAIGGGTAAIATVAETAHTIADVKDSAASLGDWLVPVLLIAVVALCGYIIYERVRQRREGWA